MQLLFSLQSATWKHCRRKLETLKEIFLYCIAANVVKWGRLKPARNQKLNCRIMDSVYWSCKILYKCFICEYCYLCVDWMSDACFMYNVCHTYRYLMFFTQLIRFGTNPLLLIETLDESAPVKRPFWFGFAYFWILIIQCILFFSIMHTIHLFMWHVSSSFVCLVYHIYIWLIQLCGF